MTTLQTTSDELYALEASLSREQVKPSYAGPQMTSDEAWALEQSLPASVAGDVADVGDLNLDSSGADVFSTPENTAPDTTRLHLDRDGADIP